MTGLAAARMSIAHGYKKFHTYIGT